MPDHFLTPRGARSKRASSAKYITIMKRHLFKKLILAIYNESSKSVRQYGMHGVFYGFNN